MNPNLHLRIKGLLIDINYVKHTLEVEWRFPNVRNSNIKDEFWLSVLFVLYKYINIRAKKLRIKNTFARYFKREKYATTLYP